MAEKKYNDFPAGTYDTDKIFLQADPTTGALEKVNLPAIQNPKVSVLVVDRLAGDDPSAYMARDDWGAGIDYLDFDDSQITVNFANPIPDAVDEVMMSAYLSTSNTALFKRIFNTGGSCVIDVGWDTEPPAGSEEYTMFVYFYELPPVP